MSPPAATSLLRATPLFESVPEPALAALAERTRMRSYRKGELVFHQGDPGDALFVVASGVLKVFVTSAEGSEMVLALLGPSDAFGELAIVDGGTRSASVEAVEPSELLSLHRAALLEALSAHPAIAKATLAALGTIARRTIEQAADLVFLDLHGRVAKLLATMAAEQSTGGGPVTLDLPITQRDLAGMVGGSRQSVNQILHHLEQRGYLAVRGRQVVVLDLGALRRRAGLAAPGPS